MGEIKLGEAIEIHQCPNNDKALMKEEEEVEYLFNKKNYFLLNYETRIDIGDIKKKGC